MCLSEALAQGAYAAAAVLGIRVPQDLSVVGFDDLHAVFASPPMTVVSHELRAIGERAGEIALAMAAGEIAPRDWRGRHEEVPSRLVIPRQHRAGAALIAPRFDRDAIGSGKRRTGVFAVILVYFLYLHVKAVTWLADDRFRACSPMPMLLQYLATTTLIIGLSLAMAPTPAAESAVAAAPVPLGMNLSTPSYANILRHFQSL